MCTWYVACCGLALAHLSLRSSTSFSSLPHVAFEISLSSFNLRRAARSEATSGGLLVTVVGGMLLSPSLHPVASLSLLFVLVLLTSRTPSPSL